MSNQKQGMVIIDNKFKVTTVEVCFCSECGKNIDKYDNYCRFCGMKVTGLRYIDDKGDSC